MTIISKLYLTAIGAALALSSIAAPAAAVSLYSITDLGSLNPLDFNNAGQILGTSNGQSVLWQNGTSIDLPSMGAIAINNLGQIAGIQDGQLLIRQTDGRIDNLGLPQCNPSNSPACTYYTVNGFNDAGQILAVADIPGAVDPTTYLLRRQPNGSIQVLYTAENLGNVGVYRISEAAMNASGQVAYSTSLRRHGGIEELQSNFTDGNATQTSIGYYPLLVSEPRGTKPSLIDSYLGTVKDINDRGQIVGSSLLGAPVYYSGKRLLATLLPTPNTAVYLGSLGGDSSEANSINNSTQIVGWAEDTSGKSRAFIWEKDRIFDLNNFLVNGTGWTLTSARFINNNEQIIGTGTFNGTARTFLLNPVKQPVPEPAAVLGLLGIGFMALLPRYRQRT